MPFGLVQNSMQLAEFVVLLTLTPLGAAVTGLRLFATYRNSRKPGLEDWMALFATVFFILSEFAALIAINILNGQDSVVQAVESPDDFKLRRKWDLVSIYGYIGHTTFVKLSVLALYHRIFGVRCIFRNWIVVLGACQFVIFSLGCVLQPLQCRPFARFLDISVPGACTSPGPYLLLLEMPNSLVDFAMVSLAIIMIRSLQLPRSTKLKLQFLFGLGVLVGIMGFVKIALNYAKPTFGKV